MEADFDKYMDPVDDGEWCEEHRRTKPCWECRRDAAIERAEADE